MSVLRALFSLPAAGSALAPRAVPNVRRRSASSVSTAGRRGDGGGRAGGAAARPDTARVRAAGRRHCPGEGEPGLPVPEENGQPRAGPEGARARRRWVARPGRALPEVPLPASSAGPAPEPLWPREMSLLGAPGGKKKPFKHLLLGTGCKNTVL